MPYNSKIHANLVVDKPYRDKLKEVTMYKGQTLKRGLELTIQKLYEDYQKETK